MTDIKTVADGVALYFDTRLKPKLSGNKKLIFSTAINVLCQHPERIVQKYGNVLELMAGFDGKKLDIDSFASALKGEMTEVPTLTIVLPILGDKLEFDAEEIDYVVSCIKSFKKEDGQ